ncbi:MAG: sigma-54-dependent transcriptional regulator [Gammaproteobacteria bacterium]
MAIAVNERPTHRLLVVDDDQDMLALLSSWLRDAGLQVDTVSSGPEALSRIDGLRPSLVITDLVMHDMDGMSLLTEIHRYNPLIPVVMLSGQAEIRDAVQAMHLGISEFLTKPVGKEDLLAHVQRILRLGVGDDQAAHRVFGKGLVYRSAAMAEVVEQAKLVAPTDVTVFISGATGTGKEVLARAIHEASPRRNQPFIGINCAAIPEQLLESELFGHEKGAFTGAATRHAGLFQAANGGTIFLDEIADMPLGLQVKLLRVLQDFEVRPVGAVKAVPVNVRMISATNANLDEAVQEGRFREDLYYRLNVVPLTLPGLAERREDIPPLLEHWLEHVAQRQHTARKRFAPEALEYLILAPWPGNVRQLMNVVELCSALVTSEVIPLRMAQKGLRDHPARIETLKLAKDAFERNYLVGVLRIAEGRVADAARIAGRNRTEFYKLLKDHQLDPTDFRRSRS